MVLGCKLFFFHTTVLGTITNILCFKYDFLGWWHQNLSLWLRTLFHAPDSCPFPACSVFSPAGLIRYSELHMAETEFINTCPNGYLHLCPSAPMMETQRSAPMMEIQRLPHLCYSSHIDLWLFLQPHHLPPYKLPIVLPFDLLFLPITHAHSSV